MISFKKLPGSALILILATVLLIENVAAQENNTSPLDTLFKCIDVADETARLACYDQQVSLLKTKETDKEIVTIDAQKAKEIQRDSFGFSLPKLNVFDLDSDDEKDNKYQTYEVKEVSIGRNGYLVKMENGHIWRQVTGDVGPRLKGKLAATVKPAAFGSFLMSIKNEKGKTVQRGIRVKRIE